MIIVNRSPSDSLTSDEGIDQIIVSADIVSYLHLRLY